MTNCEQQPVSEPAETLAGQSAFRQPRLYVCWGRARAVVSHVDVRGHVAEVRVVLRAPRGSDTTVESQGKAVQRGSGRSRKGSAKRQWKVKEKKSGSTFSAGRKLPTPGLRSQQNRGEGGQKRPKEAKRGQKGLSQGLSRGLSQGLSQGRERTHQRPSANGRQRKEPRDRHRGNRSKRDVQKEKEDRRRGEMAGALGSPPGSGDISSAWTHRWQSPGWPGRFKEITGPSGR